MSSVKVVKSKRQETQSMARERRWHTTWDALVSLRNRRVGGSFNPEKQKIPEQLPRKSAVFSSTFLRDVKIL